MAPVRASLLLLVEQLELTSHGVILSEGAIPLENTRPTSSGEERAGSY